MERGEVLLCREGGNFAPRPPDHHEHCRICAEERRRCEEACSAVLDVIE
jgi:hypothetical protein